VLGEMLTFEGRKCDDVIGNKGLRDIYKVTILLEHSYMQESADQKRRVATHIRKRMRMSALTQAGREEIA
jgi:primosomal replication protein N